MQPIRYKPKTNRGMAPAFSRAPFACFRFQFWRAPCDIPVFFFQLAIQIIFIAVTVSGNSAAIREFPHEVRRIEELNWKANQKAVISELGKTEIAYPTTTDCIRIYFKPFEKPFTDFIMVYMEVSFGALSFHLRF